MAQPLNYLPMGPCQGISDTVRAAEANKNIVNVLKYLILNKQCIEHSVILPPVSMQRKKCLIAQG